MFIQRRRSKKDIAISVIMLCRRAARFILPSSQIPTLLSCGFVLGAGADIVSHGEMKRALAAGFDPADIVFSGVGKTDADILAAFAANIGQINAESEAEVDRILALAADAHHEGPVSCRLALRINPDVATDTHEKISTGHGETKFGVALADVPRLYRRVAESGVIAAGGLAVHIGSQIMETGPFEDAWLVMRTLADELIASGFDVPVLDLGGGLGVDYATGEHADAAALAVLSTSCSATAAIRSALSLAVT